MSSNDEDGGELTALKDLLASDGWKRFTAYKDEQWGADATLQRMEAAMKIVPLGDQDAAHDAAQHVLSAQKQIKALLAWPSERVKLLTQAKPQRGWLAGQRRISR